MDANSSDTANVTATKLSEASMKKDSPPNRLTHLLAVLGAALFLAPAHATDTLTYYHWDALGSPVAATDFQGNVVWREEYKPYGERIKNEAAAQANTRWYTGHPHDTATGLTYTGARYYDPAVGRFMGVDPVSFTEKNAHSFNRYAYANNNPHKYIDPTGEVPLIVLVPIIGGAINAVVTGAEEHLYSGNIGDTLLAGGRGFVSGAVGTAAGFGVGIATKNPALTGSVAGLTENITDQLLSGRGIGSLDPVDAALATGFGAVGGVSGNAVLPPSRGRPPSLLIPRGPSNFGPNSARVVGQEAIGGAVSSTLGVAGTNVRSEQCECML